MFSLFQDDINTLASNVNHVPSNHELITSITTSSDSSTRRVLDVAGDDLKAAAPPVSKHQDAWCNQVLKLKNLHPSTPKKTHTTNPFQQFHSSSTSTLNSQEAQQAIPFQQFDSSSTRTLTNEEGQQATPFQLFHSSSTRTLTRDAEAILVPEEDMARLADLPEVRQVRFLGSPEVVSTDTGNGVSRKQQKKNTNRVYWSRNEVESMKRDAVQCARAFRTKRPATVNRLKQLFEDFCWKQSIDHDDSAETAEDEEEEELLHRFLIDWGMSSVRGLEERVVPRRVFDQDRRMALESVLAYQQILRESGIHSQTEMEAMLSMRSESASRRARMFAMYMALGDALAVAAFRSDEVYSEDDSINLA
jgi:hypothetical protein